jgi:hypothetical protein
MTNNELSLYLFHLQWQKAAGDNLERNLKAVYNLANSSTLQIISLLFLEALLWCGRVKRHV